MWYLTEVDVTTEKASILVHEFMSLKPEREFCFWRNVWKEEVSVGRKTLVVKFT